MKVLVAVVLLAVAETVILMTVSILLIELTMNRSIVYIVSESVFHYKSLSAATRFDAR